MSKKRLSKKIGMPPGSLVHTGEILVDKPGISIIDYSESQYTEYSPEKIDNTLLDIPADTTRWIKVNGLQDIKLVEALCNTFKVHPLAQEDILNTKQRPKLDDYNDYLFLTAVLYSFNKEKNEISDEQIAVVCGKNYVLLFVEGKTGRYTGIDDRIKNNVGNIRGRGTGFLLYSILDYVVDNMYLVLDEASDLIDDLEDRLMNSNDKTILNDIQTLKRHMLFVHKATWPMRDVISIITRFDSQIIDPSLKIYFRDIYDHVAQVIDTTETLRDIITGLLDIYLSNVSNNMNEIMKVLTIISTIAIPLTVISGIYGMNFKAMPELESPFGYPAVLLFMLLLVIGMLIYFKRKKWW